MMPGIFSKIEVATGQGSESMCNIDVSQEAMTLAFPGRSQLDCMIGDQVGRLCWSFVVVQSLVENGERQARL